MRWLIDGYNVLHVGGLLAADAPSGALRFARQRLLTRIASSLGDQAQRVTVVFDAARAPRSAGTFQSVRGISVLFTARGETADDRIEGLIAACGQPKELTVVTDDRRILQAARRRGCQKLKVDPFLSWLDAQSSPRPARQRESKKALVRSPAELDEWMRTFGHLDADPALGSRLPWEEQ